MRVLCTVVIFFTAYDLRITILVLTYIRLFYRGCKYSIVSQDNLYSSVILVYAPNSMVSLVGLTVVFHIALLRDMSYASER